MAALRNREGKGCRRGVLELSEFVRMHYIPPEITTVVAPREDAQLSAANPAIPLYVLTAVVGLLLGTDTLLSWINSPAWNDYRAVFGFRLALLAAVLGGARILYQTLEGLFEGRIGADLALTLACLAAIVMGEPSVAALVVFIALCGESLEGYIGSRATQAITRLFALRPTLAHVLRDGQELDVPLEQIRVGDVVVVRPGERIPCDGSVVTGSSAIDQSALTGESLPVDKRAGDGVYAGTLNQYGALTIAVEKVGQETTFGQIVEMVVAATRRKTDLERTADRLARYFLPAVLIIAALTLVSWRFSAGNWRAGWLPALAVLVVACPCPLILATPSAVLAALAWLARSGIVIKGSASLERLALVDTIAFDKTGTLTTGQPAIGDVFGFGLMTPEDVLRLAAAAERFSEHVLGRLIVDEAARRQLHVPVPQEFTAVPGAGITAWFTKSALQGGDRQQHLLLRGGPDDLCQVRVGNVRFFDAQGLHVAEHLQGWLTTLDESGQTPVLVAVQDTVIGLIGARDTVRPEAREVLQTLRSEANLSFALLTGDRLAPARQILGSVGPFETVAAELLPADKAQWIDAQQQAGRRVLMIGDGINDAPALATATVGMALGGVGSPIASEAGDIVLMGQPLTPLPGLLRLSRELVRVIQQSIYWFAFGLNGIGVLLCAIGWLNPVGAALFHEAASLAVMLNALRLLWFERWQTSGLGRFATGCGRCLEVTVEALSPSRGAQALVRYWSLIARLSLAGVAAIWLLSNLVLIRADEQALVTRFGRHQATLAPGLYWRWPLPFERVHRAEVDRLRTMQLGFRATGVTESQDDNYLGPIEWQAQHSDGDYQPITAEADMLSGEEIPVELTAEVLYRINDFPQFVYGAANVEQVLRGLAEKSIRQTVGRWGMEDILTARRPELARESLRLIQEGAKSYGLGIQIVGINLLDIHPPVAIVPHYRDVANALEEREQLLNEAQTTYVRELFSAVGEAAVRQLEHTAQPAGHPAGPRQSHQLPDWKLDDAIWNSLVSGQPGQPALAGQAGALLQAARQSETEQVEAATSDAIRFATLLAPYRAHPWLTRLHLYWTTLEDSLSNASLTIVDPSTKGRQQLFLSDSPAVEILPPALAAPPAEPPEK